MYDVCMLYAYSYKNREAIFRNGGGEGEREKRRVSQMWRKGCIHRTESLEDMAEYIQR